MENDSEILKYISKCSMIVVGLFMLNVWLFTSIMKLTSISFLMILVFGFLLLGIPTSIAIDVFADEEEKVYERQGLITKRKNRRFWQSKYVKR